jgi:hypothetical protein
MDFDSWDTFARYMIGLRVHTSGSILAAVKLVSAAFHRPYFLRTGLPLYHNRARKERRRHAANEKEDNLRGSSWDPLTQKPDTTDSVRAARPVLLFAPFYSGLGAGVSLCT